MAYSTPLDPDEREDLIRAAKMASDLKAIVERRFALAAPDLREEMTWLVANVSDAASDLLGIVANTEPMSVRQ